MISTSSSIDKANFAKAQAFSSTVQNELLSNLVSEWTFDEPEENGKTKDTWGNNHGTVMGALQVDDCVFGKWTLAWRPMEFRFLGWRACASGHSGQNLPDKKGAPGQGD